MILTTLLIVGSCTATFFGERKIGKIIKKLNNKNAYRARNILGTPAWNELKRHIQEDCHGYIYGDALVKQVLEQNYRFTCTQIYELRNVYKKKGWPNASNHVDKIAQYTLAAEFDAEDKVLNLLQGTDEKLLLMD